MRRETQRGLLSGTAPQAGSPLHGRPPISTWIARSTISAAATGIAVIAAGVPTDLLPNPLFRRMTPPTWWDRPVWLASSVLIGLIAATYVAPRTRDLAGRRILGGGLVSYFAIGCPACNKLVVLLLGLGGSLQYFQPIQPLLAVAGMALLGATLALRVHSHVTCSVPIAAD